MSRKRNIFLANIENNWQYLNKIKLRFIYHKKHTLIIELVFGNSWGLNGVGQLFVRRRNYCDRYISRRVQEKCKGLQ